MTRPIHIVLPLVLLITALACTDSRTSTGASGCTIDDDCAGNNLCRFDGPDRDEGRCEPIDGENTIFGNNANNVNNANENTGPDNNVMPGCVEGERFCAGQDAVTLCEDGVQSTLVCSDGWTCQAGDCVPPEMDARTIACLQSVRYVAACLEEVCAPEGVLLITEDLSLDCNDPSAREDLILLGDEPCEIFALSIAGGFPYCDPDNSPADYPSYGINNSYVSGYTFEYDAEVGADLDGDSRPDNTFGPLVQQLAGLLELDANAEVQRAIASGEFALGAVWLTGDLVDSDHLEVDSLELTPVEPGLVPPGYATLDSFVNGSALVANRLRDGSIENGRAHVQLGSMLIGLPFFFDIVIPVIDARLSGDVALRPEGVAFDGTLAGLVRLEDLVDGLNAQVAAQCSCLDLDGPFIDLDQGAGPQVCASVEEGQFEEGRCDTGSRCSLVAASCPIAWPVIAGQATLDTDGDGADDALGVYLYMTMIGGEILPPLP